MRNGGGRDMLFRRHLIPPSSYEWCLNFFSYIYMNGKTKRFSALSSSCKSTTLSLELYRRAYRYRNHFAASSDQFPRRFTLSDSHWRLFFSPPPPPLLLFLFLLLTPPLLLKNDDRLSRLNTGDTTQKAISAASISGVRERPATSSTAAGKQYGVSRSRWVKNSHARVRSATVAAAAAAATAAALVAAAVMEAVVAAAGGGGAGVLDTPPGAPPPLAANTATAANTRRRKVPATNAIALANGLLPSFLRKPFGGAPGPRLGLAARGGAEPPAPPAAGGEAIAALSRRGRSRSQGGAGVFPERVEEI